VGTIDWEENWKRHARTDEKDDHHHSQIPKEEISILQINYDHALSYQSRMVDDEWIRCFEKGNDPGNHLTWQRFCPFPNPSIYPIDNRLILLWNSCKKCFWFIDSSILLPELKFAKSITWQIKRGAVRAKTTQRR